MATARSSERCRHRQTVPKSRPTSWASSNPTAASSAATDGARSPRVSGGSNSAIGDLRPGTRCPQSHTHALTSRSDEGRPSPPRGSKPKLGASTVPSRRQSPMNKYDAKLAATIMKSVLFSSDRGRVVPEQPRGEPSLATTPVWSPRHDHQDSDHERQ